jgi:prepilin-type N-terminal cleavage/methylation domain-containing protein
MSRFRSSSSGVTLIELIVVLSIIGVTIAVASPSLLKRIDKFSLDSVGRQLVTAFRLAKNDARLQQREVLGNLSGDEFVLSLGEGRVQRVKMPRDVVVHSMGTEVHYIFLPSGQILGPERLELVAGGRYRGALILGPPPGSVRFELER